MNDYGFYLFTDYSEKFKRLSDEQFGQLIRALLVYKKTGEEPEIDDLVVGMAFDVIRMDIDKQAETYRNKAEAGRKGGSKTKQLEAELSKPKQTEAEESKPKQDEAEASIKRKRKIKEEEKENIKENQVREKRFTPPTLEEVQAYCQERHSPVDPVQFFNYFTEGNWTDSKGNKVRNWKQKLLTWEQYRPQARAKPVNNSDELDAFMLNIINGGNDGQTGDYENHIFDQGTVSTAF